MLKLFLALAISISLLLLVGCEANLEELMMTEGTPATVTPRPTLVPMPPTPTPTIGPTPSPKPTREPFPTPSFNSRNEDGSINRTDIEEVREMDGYLLYENKELSFSLQFPSYWKDYFIITESQSYNRFYIDFFGKSIIGQGYYYTETSDGISLFRIVSEEVWNGYDDHLWCDSLGCIGTAKGVKFYAYESLDVPLDMLDAEVIYIDKGESYYQNDKEEIELIRIDAEMGQKMLKDIRNVLRTFREIEK